jgi:single-strand DNA-binding protein
MNQLTLTGRLTQDPILKELPSGGQVCELRLAVDGMAAGRETGYINVSSFGQSGRAASEQLTKGWLVAVEGRLEHHRWETTDGQKRQDYGIVGHVEFLAAPKGQDRELSQETELAGEVDPREPGSASREGRPPATAGYGAERYGVER